MAEAGKKKKGYRLGKDLASQLQLHSLMLPGTILIILFSIVPLFGLILAFKNYQVTEGIKGVFSSPFYGFQNFKIIFSNHDFGRMLVNTLGINLIGQLVTIPITILFALFINEIANQKVRSLVQTVTYMPHFISWVVFGGIIITLLSADGGVLNTILMKLGLTDQALYEAAELDGAGRLKKMWYVTLPSIKGTIVIMVIFAVAGIMNNNFDQIYVLQNAFNLERSEVIDTYIYKVGLQQLQFGMAAAINIFKSVLAITLLFFANKVSNKLTDSGLF